MDKVEWKPVEKHISTSNLPYVTHEGIFNIGDFQLKAYILNTGQRIIDKESVEKFLGNIDDFVK